MSKGLPSTYPNFKMLWRRAKEDCSNNLFPHALRNLERAAYILSGVWFKSSKSPKMPLSPSDFVDDVSNLLDDMSGVCHVMSDLKGAYAFQALRLKASTGLDGNELDEFEVTQTELLFSIIADIHSALYTILNGIGEENLKKGKLKDAIEEFGGALEILERCSMIKDNHLHVRAVLLNRASALRLMNKVHEAELDEARSAVVQMTDPPTDVLYTHPDKIFFRPMHGGPPELYKYTPRPADDGEAGPALDRKTTTTKYDKDKPGPVPDTKRTVSKEHAQMCFQILVTVEYMRKLNDSEQAMRQLLLEEEEKKKSVAKVSKSQKRKQIKKHQQQERDSHANMALQQLKDDEQKLSSTSSASQRGLANHPSLLPIPLLSSMSKHNLSSLSPVACHGRAAAGDDLEEEFLFSEDFVCPISLEIMRDPVKTVDGSTFERASIEDWFRRGKQTNPLTNETLSSQELVPNIEMKMAIQYSL